jgi:hypothetical protein
MRRGIETAPMDGKVIILEDDASGTYDIAHWSPEAGGWIGENGEPSKLKPTHWHPMQGDDYLALDPDGSGNPSQVGPASRTRRYAIPAVLVAAAFIGTYFHAEVAAFVMRYAGQPNIFGGGTTGEQVVVAQETRLPGKDPQKTGPLPLQQQAAADQTGAQAVTQETAQDKQAVAAPVPETRQSLDQEQRAEALAQELAEARRAIDELTLQLRTEAEKTAQLLGQEREKTAGLAQAVTVTRQELTASTVQHRQVLEEERARGVALASELATARREIEVSVALLNKTREDAAQFKEIAERTTAELQQERDRTEASSRELAIARREIETNLAQNKARDYAAQFRQTGEETAVELQQERDRAKASSRELAMARGDIETNVALLNKAREDAAQLKETADRTTAELQQERDRAKASSRELEVARRDIETNVALLNKAREDAAQLKETADRTAAELQQERDRAKASSRELEMARRDIETNAAMLNKARDDAAQLKETAERTAAELQKERDSATALSRELAMARESAHRAIETRTALQRTANGQIAQVTQAVEATAPDEPSAAVPQGSPEAARLIARAGALLGQGNIGAARIVLERAAETGSAQASFMLAETYDPVILSAWGTYGTRGEATRARELYAKAHAGGIQEAKDRFNALH